MKHFLIGNLLTSSKAKTKNSSRFELTYYREVYGTPDFDTDENTKKKFLRRNIEGEIIKIPPK